MTRLLMVPTAFAFLLGGPTLARAQRVSPRRREFWVAGAMAMAVTIPLDEQIREFAARHHSRVVDQIAIPVGHAGSPGYILPVIMAGALIPRALHDPATSNAVIDIGIAYATTTLGGFVARTVIGRHRPDETGRSAKFAPFRREHEWHSFPSGHVLAVMSLATGIAIKSDRPWVTTVSYGLASAVALQRLYEQKHWASDVVAATIVGVAASASTIRWREHVRERRD